MRLDALTNLMQGWYEPSPVSPFALFGYAIFYILLSLFFIYIDNNKSSLKPKDGFTLFLFTSAMFTVAGLVCQIYTVIFERQIIIPGVNIPIGVESVALTVGVLFILSPCLLLVLTFVENVFKHIAYMPLKVVHISQGEVCDVRFFPHTMIEAKRAEGKTLITVHGREYLTFGFCDIHTVTTCLAGKIRTKSGKPHCENTPAVCSFWHKAWYWNGTRGILDKQCGDAVQQGLTDEKYFQLLNSKDKVVRELTLHNSHCPDEIKILTQLGEEPKNIPSQNSTTYHVVKSWGSLKFFRTSSRTPAVVVHVKV